MPAPQNHGLRPARPLTDVEQNFGHAGLRFMAAVVKAEPRVRERLLTNRAWFDLQLQEIPTGSRRYHVGVGAAILTAAEIAKKLKLVDFDLLGIRNELLRGILRHCRDQQTFARQTLITTWPEALCEVAIQRKDVWVVTTRQAQNTRGNDPYYIPTQISPQIHMDVWAQEMLIPKRYLRELLRSIKVQEPELIMKKIPRTYHHNRKTFAGGTEAAQRLPIVAIPFSDIGIGPNVQAFIAAALTPPANASHRVVA